MTKEGVVCLLVLRIILAFFILCSDWRRKWKG